jgi:ubiquinone/menaquinone biosynthesis C-methylase UbiE
MPQHDRPVPSRQELHRYYAAQEEDEERWHLLPTGMHRRLWRVEVMHRLWVSLGLEGSRVLDAGCGDGYSAENMFRGRPPRSYVGVDLSPGKLHRVLGRFPPPQGAAVLADLEALPLEEGCVEGALCLFALEHVPDPCAALSAIRRALKPGGLLVLAMPVVSPLQARWERLRGSQEIMDDEGFGEHLHEFSTRGVLDLVRRAGLSTLRVFHTNFRFPVYSALSARMPIRVYGALDRALSRIPLDHFGAGGRRFPLRLDVGRGSVVVVLRK